MNVCYNQVGYYPESPKRFSVPDGPFRSFEIQTIDPSVCWKTVFRGPLERVGDRLEGDFTAVKQPADYRIVLGETNTGQAIPALGETNPGQAIPPERMSFNFVIKPGVYQHLARLIGAGFRWARCGHIEGWAGVCHQDPVPLVGTDRRLDVRGGYHQSCDLRNWHDAMSAAIYGVLRFVERQPADWYCGDLAGEIRWGCEYFLKVVAPEGFVYDCQFEPIGWGPRNYYCQPTTLDAHFNCVRLLARASRRFRASDPAFADRCLETAVRIRGFTVSAPIFNASYRQPIPDLPPGSLGSDCYPQSFRESFSMLAVSIVADLDLWQATGEAPYRARAVETSKQVMALQFKEGPRAGLYRLSADRSRELGSAYNYTYLSGGQQAFVELLDLCGDDPLAPQWRAALRRSCSAAAARWDAFHGTAAPMLSSQPTPESKLAAPAEAGLEAVYYRPTKYSFPCVGDAVLFARARDILGDPELGRRAQRCFDWVLGGNPEACSMVTGVGFNHHVHTPFGQFFPSTPQIPGGFSVDLIWCEYDLPVAGIAFMVLAYL